MKRFLSVLVVALAGCGGLLPNSEPARLHAIRLPAPTVQHACPVSFSVRDLRLAGHLDRPEVVLAVEGSRVVVEGDDLWASPLRAELPRLVARALADRLAGSRLQAYPWRFNEVPRLAVSVQLDRLEAEAGQMRLDASWSLVDPRASNRPLAHGRLVESMPITVPPDAGGRADAVAEATGTALGRLADAMAARLAALPAPTVVLPTAPASPGTAAPRASAPCAPDAAR